MKRILFFLTVLGVPICGLAQQSIIYKYDVSGNQTARIVATQSQNKVSKHPQKSSDASVISDIDSIEKRDVSVNVSIESKSEFLKILTEGDLPQGSKYNLFQADGSLVRSGSLESGETSVPMQGLPNGVYLLQTCINNTLQTFKITNK